jgi:hypothetical protein
VQRALSPEHPCPLLAQTEAPLCADTPTEAEVVYRHIDTKLHPLRLQLDGSLLMALSSFFKVKAPASRDRPTDERRLDRSLGLSALERAGVLLVL